jgi:hypothetical protein
VIAERIIFNLILIFMQTQKLSLGSIKNVLSRAEMKKIMAGSDGGGGCSGDACSGSCTFTSGDCKGKSGTCSTTQSGHCVCGGVC